MREATDVFPDGVNVSDGGFCATTDAALFFVPFDLDTLDDIDDAGRLAPDTASANDGF